MKEDNFFNSKSYQRECTELFQPLSCQIRMRFRAETLRVVQRLPVESKRKTKLF